MKRRTLSLGISFLILLAALAISMRTQAQFGPDQAHTMNPKNLFAVTGKVDHPFAISVSVLRNMPQIQVNVVRDNRSVTYAGVSLKDLLAKAVLSADSAKPNQLALTAINLGGNPITLSPECTQAVFRDGTQVIVADAINGKPLKDDSGPLMLIVPNEKPSAQIVPNLARIRVGTTN